MQMKNNKGVTLIAMIVTIITLGIILAITIFYGIPNMDRVQNNRIKSDILMIQQSVVQQYGLAMTKNALGKNADAIYTDTALTNDTNRPKELYGVRIADTKELENLGFKTYLIKYDITSESQEDLTYEQYYYELSSSDLLSLGIDENNSIYKHDYKYVVNYSTGEVFDVQNKIYKKEDTNPKNQTTVSLPGTNNKIETENQSYDFNDE